MNPVIEAALITNGTTVGIAGATGLTALWRLGRNRRHRRRTTRVEEFQDCSGVLREANRDLGRELRVNAERAARGANVGELILPAGEVAHVNLGPSVSRKADAAQAVAYDRVRIAADRVRVDNPVLVELNERWRRLSWLHSNDSGDVTAGEESEAFDAFNTACAQTLATRSGKLSKRQTKAWRVKLAQAKGDDADNTDPEAD